MDLLFFAIGRIPLDIFPFLFYNRIGIGSMKLSAEKPHHVFKDICLLKKLSLNRKDQMTAVIESVTEARCLSVLFLFPREGVFSLTSYKIAVIDGQGGGIGRHITAALREALNEEVKIYALGTNAIAMGNILKGGANEAACGENAIIQTAGKVDLIVGSLAILISGSMCGEPPLPPAADSISSMLSSLPVSIFGSPPSVKVLFAVFRR